VSSTNEQNNENVFSFNYVSVFDFSAQSVKCLEDEKSCFTTALENEFSIDGGPSIKMSRKKECGRGNVIGVYLSSKTTCHCCPVPSMKKVRMMMMMTSK